MELQENDILVFKSGTKREYTQRDAWMFEHFYNQDLTCKTNDRFTIVKILRPQYEIIYDRSKSKIKSKK